MLRLITKAVIFVWLKKQLDNSLIVIYKSCQYQPTNKKIYQQISWLDDQFLLIR